ncbi:MAG TPA: ribosome small subunit-dependent GTPase A [Spirochaetota bacterium]|nr:ribosome small subunit-dependent GTPase A [Spirochaetota bacterium]
MEKGIGTVVKVFGMYSTVLYEGRRINCVLRGRMRREKSVRKYSDPVAVGDLARIELDREGTGVISEILPRKNAFSRKEKGRNRKEDVIASNLDRIVIMQSFDNPRLNLRFVDRLSVRACKDGIPMLLCINKRDLAEKGDVTHIMEYYDNAPIDLALVSAKTGEGIEDFGRFIAQNASLFVGYSGVGKTSILNRLHPDLDLRVSEISESTGKGRHTTTNVEMIYSVDGTRIIDTPGLREFGLVDIEPETAGDYFYEFGDFAEECAFRPCSHDHEPDCGVKRMVDAGRIHEDRYISYLNILQSLRESHERKYQ